LGPTEVVRSFLQFDQFQISLWKPDINIAMCKNWYKFSPNNGVTGFYIKITLKTSQNVKKSCTSLCTLYMLIQKHIHKFSDKHALSYQNNTKSQRNHVFPACFLSI
jgi:hypothetical protein